MEANRDNKKITMYRKVIDKKTDYLSGRVKTGDPQDKHVMRMNHELNALCWMLELTEHIRDELTEHEREVDNLKRKIEHQRKMFTRIQGQCGLPDPIKACQCILKTTNEALKTEINERKKEI